MTIKKLLNFVLLILMCSFQVFAKAGCSGVLEDENGYKIVTATPEEQLPRARNVTGPDGATYHKWWTLYESWVVSNGAIAWSIQEHFRVCNLNGCQDYIPFIVNPSGTFGCSPDEPNKTK
jgi:hypothetical protein